MTERFKAWYLAHIVPGFYKTYSWVSSAIGVLIAFGPDAANLVIDHSDLVVSAFPTLSNSTKALVLLAAHVAVLVLRPVKQPQKDA